MIKKLFIAFLSLLLSLAFINFNNIHVEAQSSKQEIERRGNACGVIAEKPTVDRSYVNEDGEQVYHYEDNTQVVYHSDGTITIYSLFGPEIEDGKTTKIAWIAIGKVILKIVAGVVSTCSGIQYVTGVDVCRIALQYISHPTKTEYNVDGRYHSGYIPGCQPQYSGPCNAGYWEYRVY